MLKMIRIWPFQWPPTEIPHNNLSEWAVITKLFLKKCLWSILWAPWTSLRRSHIDRCYQHRYRFQIIYQETENMPREREISPQNMLHIDAGLRVSCLKPTMKISNIPPSWLRNRLCFKKNHSRQGKEMRRRIILQILFVRAHIGMRHIIKKWFVLIVFLFCTNRRKKKGGSCGLEGGGLMRKRVAPPFVSWCTWHNDSQKLLNR